MSEQRGKFILNQHITEERLRRFLHYMGQDKITPTDSISTDVIDELIDKYDSMMKEGLIEHTHLGKAGDPYIFNLPFNKQYIPFYQLLLAADDALNRMYRLYSCGRLDESEMKKDRYVIASLLDSTQDLLQRSSK